MSNERTEAKRGMLLVVEDDPAVARSIARLVTANAACVFVETIAAAREHLESGMLLAGAIIDIGLPDGNGLELLRTIRDRGVFAPVLVLTAQLERSLVNEAHALGAAYVCKPEFRRNVESFVEQIARFDQGPNQARVEVAVDAASASYGLTPREREILGRAAQGTPRSHLAEVLRVSENTVKTQIRSMLEKAGQSSLSELVWAVRQRAVTTRG